MKKISILLVCLLSVGSVFCFTGCNDDKSADDKAKEGVQTKAVTVDDDDDTCPDCKKHGMPKVRFDFKDGRPS